MSTLLRDLARFPSVDTISADAHGIRIRLHGVLGLSSIGHVIALTEPVRTGSTLTCTGELDGMPVTVIAPVLDDKAVSA